MASASTDGVEQAWALRECCVPGRGKSGLPTSREVCVHSKEGGCAACAAYRVDEPDRSHTVEENQVACAAHLTVENSGVYGMQGVQSPATQKQPSPEVE